MQLVFVSFKSQKSLLDPPWQCNLMSSLPIRVAEVGVLAETAKYPSMLASAAKNAVLAQIISPEIKISTEAIFYY